MLKSIDRYIFRTAFGAFAIVLGSLTVVIWLTQALRDIDLMTNERQTVFVFIGITGLVIPLLMLIIAPIALVIAVTYTLNKLNSDSEIVVMSAAGMSPWRMFRPFLAVAVLGMLFTGFLSAYLAPWGLRELRDWATAVRADLVTNIAQPGQFTTIEGGLTFHVRERRASGQLRGIVIDDIRDPQSRVTFLAEDGEVVKGKNGTFLLLQNGSLQRHKANERDPSIVLFERYAFDLSQLTSGVRLGGYGARERYIWDLTDADQNDPVLKTQQGQLRTEFHDRIVAPLYPLAFIFIAYSVLGQPRTTRQSRGFSVGLTIAGISAVRLTGFASTVLAAHIPSAVVIMYAVLALSIGLGIFTISSGITIEQPAFLSNAIRAIRERAEQRLVSRFRSS